ncbi:MAG: DNA-binding protein Alba [Candidatus Pacearchaeota archaeon]
MEKKKHNKEAGIVTKTSETNRVFIGDKPFMKYVIATIMQLKENPEVTIKARGKFISRGVDIAEVTKKRFKEQENIELEDSIKIGTDKFENEENKKINVSTIDITLTKK